MANQLKNIVDRKTYQSNLRIELDKINQKYLEVIRQKQKIEIEKKEAQIQM